MPVTPSPSSALRSAVEDACHRGCAVLPEADAKAVLAEAGIAVPRGVVTVRVDDIPDELSEPLVLKAVSPTLVHKSDAGGVRLGLTRGQLSDAAGQMALDLSAHGHVVEAYLIEEQAAGGTEVIVGAVRQAGIGWVVMVGLGGIFVEILDDVSLGIAPLSRCRAAEMVSRLRGVELLRGARNQSAAAGESVLIDLVHTIAGPAGLLDQLPASVTEIDLNPVVISADGALVLDARFVLATSPSDDDVVVPEAEQQDAAPSRTDFTSLLSPRRVAVLGASATGNTLANRFIRQSRAYGFDGEIVPIHPHADTIEGLTAARSLADVCSTGHPVDYAFIAVAADKVPDTLSGVADGGVRFAQVISSGFGEVNGGQSRNTALIRAARAAGTRILGPNCLGTHSALGRITFVEDAPTTPGTVAVISQSGGLSVDILRHGTARGLRFHSVVSIGNGADVDAAELVGHMLHDPGVGVIGLYLESLPAARRVLDAYGARPAKPLVLLAGGRTPAGSSAAASHTGALIGSHRLWPALARQGSMVLVDGLDDFVSVLAGVQSTDVSGPRIPHEVLLFGNGGGASVLASDTFYKLGLSTPTLPEEVVRELEALKLPPGTALSNPVDLPAGALAVDSGRLAETVLAHAVARSTARIAISHFNVGIVYRNLKARHGDVTANLVASVTRVHEQYPHTTHLLVLKQDGTAKIAEMIEKYRVTAEEAGLAVFDDIGDAAVAAAALAYLSDRYHDTRASRPASYPPRRKADP